MPKKRKKYKSTTAIRQDMKAEGAYTYYYHCNNCGCGDLMKGHKYCPDCGLNIREFRK